MEYQSVLVILVPEAESLVGAFRSKYDSSAKDGMPAHITINFPFVPAERDMSGVVDSLTDLFSRFRSFEYSLISAKRWPEVLYLRPSPAKPFVDLINAVVRLYPESPPYGGMHGDPVPHLTVAATDDQPTLYDVEHSFAIACKGKLPIKASASEIWLMDNKTGSWTKRVSFPLGK